MNNNVSNLIDKITYNIGYVLTSIVLSMIYVISGRKGCVKFSNKLQKVIDNYKKKRA